MKRFLITNPTKFTGTAEFIFNEAGVLNKIDCTNATMDAPTMQAFKAAAPANLERLMNTPWCSAETTVVEADFEVNFEMFWKKYNNKVNKKRCEGIWVKMTKTQQVKAFFGIDAYDKFLKLNKWRTKADPDTYLRNEMYENEYQ